MDETNPFDAPASDHVAVAGSADVEIASVGQRAAGYLIDWFLQWTPAAVGMVLLLPGVDDANAEIPPAAATIGVICFSLVPVIVLAQWAGIAAVGQTVGKRLVGTRIVRTDGSPAGVAHGVVFRHFGFGLLFLTCNMLRMGWLLYLFDVVSLFTNKRRQAIHDQVASTMVIRVHPSA